MTTKAPSAFYWDDVLCTAHLSLPLHSACRHEHVRLLHSLPQSNGGMRGRGERQQHCLVWRNPAQELIEAAGSDGRDLGQFQQLVCCKLL